MQYKSFYESPLGRIVLISNGNCLTHLFFQNSRFIDKLEKINAVISNDLEIFKKVKNWLDCYFKGEEPNLEEIPMKISGSPFCLAVIEKIKSIGYGKTKTYGEIAKEMELETGKKVSAQAVGYAVGHNPISIIVPCHRVMGAGCNLTGYGAGIDIKLKLLKLEAVDVDKFIIPKKGNAL